VATDWSREEVEATVADYFAMLEAELAGTRYDKTEHRRQLLPALDARSEGSIEFKHQNISAVLIALGFPYISGYKPRSNYQHLLYEVVSDRLASNRGLVALVEADADRAVSVPTAEDILKALTDPPKPTTPGPRTSEKIPHFLPRPVNYLEREARNRALGLAGEEFVINFERARLISIRREALASKIEHVSKIRGDAEGFFDSVRREGDRRRICGLAPIYMTVRTAGAGRGALLKYAQWPDPNAVVTFASLALV